MVSSRVLPGAEGFTFEGSGTIGFLLQHGFSGTPASMRPFGEWLAERGCMVAAPRLSGHGTKWEDLEGVTWQDWERDASGALDELGAKSQAVVAVGLSMGGALVLHLAAKHPEKLRGVVVINALVRRPELALAPVIRLFTRTVKGVGNDIKKPGQDEIVYDRIPVKGVNQLGKVLRVTERELSSMTLPLLVFSSPEDHTVKPMNSRLVMKKAGSSKKELVTLGNSYHVATLDYDAETIFERTLEFARALTAAPEASAPPA